MNNFDDFLVFLDKNKEEYFNSFHDTSTEIKFPITNSLELQFFLKTIGKNNYEQTLNLLRIYHDWNSENSHK